MSRRTGASPFAVLGLPAQPGLTDDDVRAVWRRIAAATHPDRADGGDPGRFAAAAAAYSTLRTAAGRGEALADLAGQGGPLARDPARRPRRHAAALGWRVRHGRPGRLALRVTLAAAAAAAVVVIGGTRPAVPAVITGLLTWLILTGRHDLAPPR